jgi:hemerythrin-like domain-containing protein
MAVQIGAKPDAGFDNPLGMLADCHRRIESFLRVLCHVAETRQDGTLSTDERSAVESALEYFRTGGQRHTQDEEESLFPRMAGGGAEALEELGKLEHEHSEANELHGIVDELFSEWMAAGQLEEAQRGALRAATDRLQDLYREHIRVEEEIVFPQAARRLSAEALTAMGAEFRARRLG